MPELPEVETVKEALKEKLFTKSRIVKDIEIRYSGIIHDIGIEKFRKTIINQELTNIKRYGKYLFFQFEANSIISHLRMEGKYRFYEKTDDYILTKHDHIIFYFTDESVLIYNDTRKFGTMEVTRINEEMELNSVAKLGVEANDKAKLNVQYLVSKIKNPNKRIKDFLLDQNNLAGLGNIYVDEVLFASKVHPEKKVGTITKQKWQQIIDNSIEILDTAIENKGSTVKSFSISQDQEGNFQHELKVYGRKNEECVNCSTKIKKIKVGSRGTHYCPKCQRK